MCLLFGRWPARISAGSPTVPMITLRYGCFTLEEGILGIIWVEGWLYPRGEEKNPVGIKTPNIPVVPTPSPCILLKICTSDTRDFRVVLVCDLNGK